MNTTPLHTTESFTRREREVLLGYLEGLQGKEIAARLFRSYNTIIRHTASMFQKANVHSIHELISKWYQEQFGIQIEELRRRCGAMVLLGLFLTFTISGGDDQIARRSSRRRREDRIEIQA